MKNFFENNFNKARDDWDKRHKQGWGRDKEMKDEGVELRLRKEGIVNFFEEHREEIKNVLDIACGAGRLLIPLAQRKFKMTGLDFSSEALKIAKEKLEKENLEADLVIGDFHSLPFASESFDAALSTDALNRNTWVKAKITWKEIARVLRPDGYFYLQTSSDSRPLKERENQKMTEMKEPEDEEFPKIRHGITYHKQEGEFTEPEMHLYSKDEIEALGKYAGLKIVGEPEDKDGKWKVIYQKQKVIE